MDIIKSVASRRRSLQEELLASITERYRPKGVVIASIRARWDEMPETNAKAEDVERWIAEGRL